MLNAKARPVARSVKQACQAKELRETELGGVEMETVWLPTDRTCEREARWAMRQILLRRMSPTLPFFSCAS